MRGGGRQECGRCQLLLPAGPGSGPKGRGGAAEVCSRVVPGHGAARHGGARPAAAPPRPLVASVEGECVADGVEGACCWEWSSLGLISWHGFRAQQLSQVISNASVLIPFTLCMYSASPCARLLSLARTPFCSILVLFLCVLFDHFGKSLNIEKLNMHYCTPCQKSVCGVCVCVCVCS